MQYQTFSDETFEGYPIAVLAPKLEADGIVKEYINPGNINPDNVIAYKLHQTGKKTPAGVQREFLDELMPTLAELSCEVLLVTDAAYFKTITGVDKADAYLGYVLPNTYPESLKGCFRVIFIPNYRQVFYDPQRTRARITQALDALYDWEKGTYQDPGQTVIKNAYYPETVEEIMEWLERLYEMDCDLTCDIEGFSLKHYDAGLGTIGFAWNKHEGIAFAVDLGPKGKIVRQLLTTFFINFKRRLIFHNISYDATVLIYQLFMEHLCDTEGLLNGLEIMLSNWECTKLISYLATNSCAGNKLGLKDQAQEFAGNYAVEEIKDIRQIPLPQLLEYNLVDCLSTWYVYEKHWDTLVADQQEEIYTELFKPAILDIVQMQLTGMPLDMDKVAYARKVFETDRNDALARIQQHKLVREFVYTLDEEHVEKRNAELKVKQIKLGDEPQEFNPNSNPQKQRLIYDLIGLPIIERTDTKAPAVGSEVLEKLKAYTDSQSVKDLIDAFLEFAAVDKLYGTFIPAMESAVQGPDGCFYLFGSFNLGGTVSGRLSSSGPNLQTIPSKKNKFAKIDYSKIIKDCFRAPKGWIMIGLDFNSLEDVISAVTTKDPNKLKVYTDGFDGHCLRAQSYFGEKMPDIEMAPEGVACYRAMIGEKEIFFHADEEIDYLGTKLTGQELWEQLHNVQEAA